MSYNKSYKNFSYVALGRIIVSAVLAIFFLIFATILEPTDFGKLGYLIALAGTFSVVSRFGLPQTVVVFIAKEKKLLSDQVNLLAVILACVATIILLFINQYAAFLCLAISFFILYQHNLLGEKKIQNISKKFNPSYHNNFYYFLSIVFCFRYSRNFTRYGIG